MRWNHLVKRDAESNRRKRKCLYLLNYLDDGGRKPGQNQENRRMKLLWQILIT